MSYIDKSGIEHNSFYETDSDLNIESQTEEELREYKRLIGMPLAEDYDELISCLIDPIPNKKEFTEYDFIRLFLATLSKKGIYKIDTVKLSYHLVNFYKIDDFKDILVMPVKKQIEGDYVDLSECINNAHLYGLISNPIQNSNERLIWVSSFEGIVSAYDEETISKMNALAEIYVNLPKNLTEVSVDFYNQINGTWSREQLLRRFSERKSELHFIRDNYSKCDTGTVTPLRKIKK